MKILPTLDNLRTLIPSYLQCLIPYFLLSFCKSPLDYLVGGASQDRTDDPLRARQVLSQLSYGPFSWWAWIDLNYRPHAYQACALTN